MERPTVTIDSVLEQALKELASPTSRVRFSLPFSEDYARSLLTASYSRCVALRSKEYVADDHTLQRIGKMAKWLTSPSMKPMLLLYGGVGNGKTTMVKAVQLMLAIIGQKAKQVTSSYPFLTTGQDDKGKGAEWETYENLPTVKIVTAQSLADLAKREDSEYERLKTARFLVIDDLGCEPQTVKVYGTEVTPVTDLLYVRYDKMLTTIVTTNFKSQGIREVYGERVADRFNEVFEKIGYTGKSYR